MSSCVSHKSSSRRGRRRCPTSAPFESPSDRRQGCVHLNFRPTPRFSTTIGLPSVATMRSGYRHRWMVPRTFTIAFAKQHPVTRRSSASLLRPQGIHCLRCRRPQVSHWDRKEIVDRQLAGGNRTFPFQPVYPINSARANWSDVGVEMRDFIKVYDEVCAYVRCRRKFIRRFYSECTVA
jgi:hypothetical protein